MKIEVNKEKIEEDKKVPGDRRTMKIISQLANSIDKNIQTTFEVPSDFPDGKMPYLDTKIWMNYNDENCPQGKLMHQYFEKPMTTRLVVEKQSAIGDRETRTIHTQSIIRILRNCHQDLPQEEVLCVYFSY